MPLSATAPRIKRQFLVAALPAIALVHRSSTRVLGPTAELSWLQHSRRTVSLLSWRCEPGCVSGWGDSLGAIVAPARDVEGAVSFDLARDLADPNACIATEVFRDLAVRDRQESLPEVGKAVAVLPESLAAPPGMNVYAVSTPETA